MTPVTVAALALLVGACDDAPRWEIGVRLAPDQDVLQGADRLEVRVDGDATRFDPDDEDLVLPTVGEDEVLDDIQLRAYLGPDLTAFGRTGPLVYREDREPDPIYFGRVRLFARTEGTPPPGGGFVTAIEGGAWVATAAGLARYDHATGAFADGPALEGADRARFAALESGAIVALIEDRAYALVGDAFELRATDLPDATGAALAAVPGDRVLVVGPERVWMWDPASPSDADVRHELASPRIGASATLVAGHDDVPDRVLVAGGRHAFDETPLPDLLVVQIEPAATFEDPLETLAVARSDHAALVVGSQLDSVWVLGGRAAGGAPTASVEEIVVGRESAQTVDPAPEPLFRARAGAAAIVLAGPTPDILLCGGEDETGADALLAELYRWYLGVGSSVLTGELPAPIPSPAAAVLHDGALFVAGDGAAAVYVSGPE